MTWRIWRLAALGLTSLLALASWSTWQYAHQEAAHHRAVERLERQIEDLAARCGQRFDR